MIENNLLRDPVLIILQYLSVKDIISVSKVCQEAILLCL